MEELSLVTKIQHDPAYVEVNFCTQKAELVKTRIKYIFVLDKSRSNRENYPLDADGEPIYPIVADPSLGTDPAGDRRYPPLIQFLNNSPLNDEYRYYSLINFSNDGRRVQGFTQDRAAFQTVVQSELDNLTDEGATNYIDALEEVRALIDGDITAAKAASDPISSTYLVIFVSDGFPIMSIDRLRPDLIQVQSSDQILQDVRNIVLLQQAEPKYVDSINFFTGYYYVNGNEDPDARALLKDMAEKAGNGVAYEFGTGEVVDFSIFTVPPKLLKYNLSEILVSNVSTAWATDGTLQADSDMDGLADDDEQVLGSDSWLADSDANGVSDLVEYRVYGRPCASSSCSRSGARNYRSGVCSGFSFSDNDNDGLNNCEEAVIQNGGGINEFDSNGDMIPDGLALRSGIELKSGTSPANGDPDFDGVSNYQEIKTGMPVAVSNDQFTGATPYRYDLEVVSASGLQECYRLRVYDVNTAGPNNLIRVHIVQTTPVILNRRLYQVAEKRYSGDSKKLVIQRQGSEAAGVWR